MKRASYREAVWWIALNDSAGDPNALSEIAVSELVSSILVADIFGVHEARVGKDVVRQRKAIAKTEGK